MWLFGDLKKIKCTSDFFFQIQKFPGIVPVVACFTLPLTERHPTFSHLKYSSLLT
ncbi:MAG: hypothetical protein ACI90V_008412 [Bacillariaceae sp.]|jgi:hypothetical protein